VPIRQAIRPAIRLLVRQAPDEPGW